MVRQDALPILILRPNRPIAEVFELKDTLPIQEKDPRRNTFVAIGEFNPETLNAMPRNLTTPTKRRLKVEFEPQQVSDAEPLATY